MYGGLPLGADLFRFISEPHLGGINGFKNRLNDLYIIQINIINTNFIPLQFFRFYLYLYQYNKFDTCQLIL